MTCAVISGSLEKVSQRDGRANSTGYGTITTICIDNDLWRLIYFGMNETHTHSYSFKWD